MIDPISPPLLTADIPGVGGRIRAEIDDFEVEEIPAYDPAGAGDHLFLWIEKRGMGAEYFVRQLAQRLAVSPNEIGSAGLKDRHAVTRQWISAPLQAEVRLAALEGDGIRLLQTSRHTNKLKAGHLRGNRFRILIRETTVGAEVEPIIERIRTQGLLNYYGEQRFGRGRETFDIGLKLLRGERLDRRPSRFLEKLALSSVQSWLFNMTLAQRLTDGLLRAVLSGDVMTKWPVGGMFTAEDVPTEQTRFDARETVHAGPIFGRKTFPAKGVAAEREATVLAASGVEIGQFSRFGKLMMGTRRQNIVYVDDLQAKAEADGLRVEFSLPAGSYATILLRELMKTAGAETTEDEPPTDGDG